jgi:hypothetical protein
MAVSYDGGETFENRLLSANSFVPNKGVFFGDYTNISATNGIVRPIWTSMIGRKTEVWTALYTETKSTVETKGMESVAPKTYPNPFSDLVNIEFNLEEKGKVNLVLLDTSGKEVYRKKWKMQAGTQKLKLNTNKLKLEPGMYIYQLITPSVTYSNRMVYRP